MRLLFTEVTEPADPVGPQADLSPQTLSQALQLLLDKSWGHQVTVGEIEESLRGRGLSLMILFLSMPFCLPIPLPGLSVPFGIALIILSFRLMIGERSWLPRRVREHPFASSQLRMIVSACLPYAKWIERCVRPRFWFHSMPLGREIISGTVMGSALILSLPLPVPFSNVMPALGIVFLALAWMERDGVACGVGLFFSLLSWLYVLLIGKLGWVGVHALIGKWTGE